MTIGPKESIEAFVVDVLNAGRLELVDRLVGQEATLHGAPGGPGNARDVLATNLAGLKQAIPDLRVTIDLIVVEEATASARLRLEGTHAGPFLGVAGTGRRFEIAESLTFRVQGGQVHDIWVMLDAAAFYKQVGATTQVEVAA